MKRLLHIVLLATFLLLCCSSAFAQQPPAPVAATVLTSLSPGVLVVSFVGLLYAVIMHAVNTGTILNGVPVPAKFLSYLGVVGVFVGNFWQVLSAAPALSGLVVINAAFAGFYGLLGYSAGTSLAVHLKAAGVKAAMHKVPMVAGVFLAARCLCACSTLGSPSTAAVGPSLDVVACILSTVSADVTQGKTWSACIADAVTQCGTDASTVATVWAAHVHAEVIEGIVPKMPVPDGGAQ